MKKPKIREHSSSGISKDTLKFKKFKKIVKKNVRNDNDEKNE
jgi:hypothetical protein